MTENWWSIEVLGEGAEAAAWRAAHGEALVESALTNGAQEWAWHEFGWGVVFEVAFADEEEWERWRSLPGTKAALDAVPDPVDGLLIYRGRGGSSGSPMPRRPRLSPGAAAVALPEPEDDIVLELVDEQAVPPPYSDPVRLAK